MEKKISVMEIIAGGKRKGKQVETREKKEKKKKNKMYDAISLVTIARPGKLMISTRNYGLIRGKLLRVLIAVRSVFSSEHEFSPTWPTCLLRSFVFTGLKLLSNKTHNPLSYNR